MTHAVTCPNCKTALYGPYCAHCGQYQKDNNRMLLTLINEAFEDVFKLDSKAWRTTFALLFKPGFLSTEYFAGRRARYVPPLRLYIITSIVFFLTLSASNFFGSRDLVVVAEPDIELAEPDTELVEPDTELVEPSATISDQVNQEIEEWNISFLSDENTAKLKSTVKRQTEKLNETINQDPSAIATMLIDLFPPIMFVLLPVFAALLKLFYLFTGRFYTQHLILAVHNHCFVYAVLTCNALLDVVTVGQISAWLNVVILIWLPLYMRYSMLNVYQQSKMLTNIKFVGLLICYSALLAAGGVVALLFGFLTL